MEEAITTPAVIAAAVTAAGATAVWVVGTLVTGRRNKNGRQREMFAKAFTACVRYEEFPYVVCRCRVDRPEEERHRISDELRLVQQELAYYTLWIQAESRTVGRAYEALVGAIRAVAGTQIHEAWKVQGAVSDTDMNIVGVDLSGIAAFKREFIEEVTDHLSLMPNWLRKRVRRKQQAEPSA